MMNDQSLRNGGRVILFLLLVVCVSAIVHSIKTAFKAEENKCDFKMMGSYVCIVCSKGGITCKWN